MKITLLTALLGLVLVASAQPVITSFSPLNGSAGTSVTITGSGFNVTASNNKVMVGIASANISSATATQLVITIPDAASGNGRITVIDKSTNLSGISRQSFVRTFAGGIAATGSVSNQFLTYNTMTGANLVEGATNYMGFKNATGDFDGDGKIDLAEMATTASLSMTIFQNTSAIGGPLTGSSFTSVATLTLDAGSLTVYPFATDINNDGKLDILVSRSTGFTVFINNSTGIGNFSFTKTTFSPSPTFYSSKSILVDLDKDGLPDIASINVDATGISYYKNTSSGGTLGFNILPLNKVAPEKIGDIIATDLDNDGDEDIIVSSSSGSSYQSVYYELNNNSIAGTINMSSAFGSIYALLPLGSYSGRPVALAAADFDGDGDMDIASVTKGGSGTAGGWIYIHRNDGSLNFTSFAAGSFTNASNITYCIRTADLNGDGKTDLVVPSQNSGGISGLMNNYNSGSLSATDFPAVTSFPSSHLSACLSVEDFNNDGKLDMISDQYSSSTLRLYTGGSNTYYPKSLGASALQTLSNWSSTLDGTGSSPASFASPNTFYLSNAAGTTSFALGGMLNITGTLFIPTGATLAIGTYNLTLSSAFTNNGTISSSTGAVVLNGSSAQVFNGNGTYGAVNIDNTNGTSLGGNVTVNGAITFINGLLSTGNYTLTLSSTSSGSSLTSYVKTAGTGMVKTNISNGSSFTFPVGNSAYNPVTITNNSGSADDFTVRVLDEMYVNGSNGTVYSSSHVQRTWDIGKTTANGGSGINLLFNWNAGEVTGTLNHPALYHYTGTWDEQTTGTTNPTAMSLTYTGYAGSFSPFSIAQSNSILPVTWQDFSATLHSGKVQLQWSTGNEFNTKEFSVQRSADGVNWNEINKLLSGGNSIVLRSYSFTDGSPLDGINYYRIVLVDLDGKQQLSRIVSVTTSKNARHLSVFPNPVKSGILYVNLPDAGRVRIFNTIGACTFDKQLSAGIQSLSTGSLPAGIYRLQAGAERITFVVQ